MYGVDLLSTIPALLGRLTFYASLCAILILLVQRVLGRFLTYRWRYLLWTILLIRCLVPVFVPAPVHPVNLLSHISATLRSDSGPSERLDGLYRPMDTSVGSEPEADLPVSEQAPTSSPTGDYLAGAAGTYLLSALAVLWLVGALARFGVTVFRNRRTSRAAIGDVSPVPRWLQETFHECRQQLDLGAWPVLIVTDHVTAPCLVGAVRPRILVPPFLVKTEARERLRHVLLHEMTHVKLGDIWLSWVWAVALALHWFNPLLWWVGYRMQLDREYACDESVLRILKSEERPHYGRSLLEMARKLPDAVLKVGMAGIAENKRKTERRIVMITRYRPAGMRHAVVGLALFLVLGVVGLSAPVVEAREPLPAAKAELMGRVEHFFMNNYRDVTTRKSLEWGDVETLKNGNKSIRYKAHAMIWDRKKIILHQVFTFDANGAYVGAKKLADDGQVVVPEKVDTTTKAGMQKRVEKFFSRNYIDISKRKTLEWGDVGTDKNGNRFIRYKYEATIRGKDVITNNQVFTFSPEGEYISVKKVASDTALPKGASSPEAAVRGFAKAALAGDVKAALAYVNPQGYDYEDIRRGLTPPGDGPLVQLFAHVDPAAPIDVKIDNQTEDAAAFHWLMTFKEEFRAGGRTFKAGETFDLDGNLKKVGDVWLIQGI